MRRYVGPGPGKAVFATSTISLSLATGLDREAIESVGSAARLLRTVKASVEPFTNLLYLCRPCLPQASCRHFWARSRKEALPARQDGEERHEEHGGCWTRKNGSCCKPAILPSPAQSTSNYSILTQRFSSNNSPFGVKPATTMLATSPINLAS